MQIGGKFAHGTAAVRHGVFLGCVHLGERLVAALGYEQRVVAESFGAAFGGDDMSLDNALEQVFFPVENQRDDRAERARRFVFPSKFRSSSRLLAAKS